MAGPGLDPSAPGGEGPAEELKAVLARVADAVTPRGRRFTDVEVAAESGIDLELAHRLRRAMGLPDVPVGEEAFLYADVEALQRVRHLVETGQLADSDLLHMARTLGLAAARMADAVVGFWSDRVAAGAAMDMLDEERLDELERVIGYLFRRHLLDAVSRYAAALTDAGEGPPVAVGFADLVGFTSLSEQLSDRQTADLVERFEGLATDVVVGGNGRVIKMIGDQVMHVSPLDSAAEIALALSESFGGPDLPAVRVGVASGTVVEHGGDLFGPVVNLAQRATMAARPGTVLISAGLAEHLSSDPRYRLVGLRPMRLKGIGRTELWALKRAEAISRPAGTGRRR